MHSYAPCFFLSIILFFLPHYSIKTLQSLQDTKTIIATLSLDEKIGQLFMMGVLADSIDNPLNKKFKPTLPTGALPENAATIINQYHIGNIIFIGHGSPKSLSSILSSIKSSMTTNKAIPLLVAIDAEWGTAMRLDHITAYPKAMTLAALPPEQEHLIYEAGYAIGKECASLGIHMNLAPVADVNTNNQNPIIGERAFGSNPDRAKNNAQLFTKGLMAAGIIACAKHFPGHGDTNTDSHKTLPIIPWSLDELTTRELIPFTALIDSDIDAIMMGHIAVPALDPTHTPASLSPLITTTLLRTSLGYTGALITDGLNMNGLSQYSHSERAIKAILAGNDILLLPQDIPSTFKAIKDAIQKNIITESMIDDHVEKVLHLKKTITQSMHHDTQFTQNNTLINTLFEKAFTNVHQTSPILPPADYIIEYTSSPESSSLFKTVATSLSIPYLNNPSKNTLDVLSDNTPYAHWVIIAHRVPENTPLPETTPYTALDIATKNNFTTTVITFENIYHIHTYKQATCLLTGYEEHLSAYYAAKNYLTKNLIPVGILPIES